MEDIFPQVARGHNRKISAACPR